jgi:hypothetical protein
MNIEEPEIGNCPVGSNGSQHPKQQVTQYAESSTLHRATYQSGYNRSY